MTRSEMQTALKTGFNKQGRRVSESMTVKYMFALNRMDANKFVTEQYRGFEISGGNGHWYVKGETIWQTIYTSRAKAMEAVDKCLKLRAILADGSLTEL